MKTRFLFIPVLCAASALLLIVSPGAQAGYIVTLQQVGADVVATGSGAIDLTGLRFTGEGGLGATIVASAAFIPGRCPKLT